LSRKIEKSAAGKATIFATTAFLLVLSTTSPAQAGNFLGQQDSQAKETHAADAKKGACEKDPAQRVKAQILIKAPPELVWYSVHEERKHDPDMAYSKVIEEGVNESKLEQKFNIIPIIGSATCLMHQHEVPLQRIDYKLIKSDHLKAMEGSWVFTPAENGKATLLELSTHLDMGIPFSRTIINGFTQKKIERRLAHVKELAEDLHSKNVQVAANGDIKTE